MRLLIIEDTKKIAKALKKGLEREGFAVDIAYDGESGLAAAEAISYDVLVVDWMLPERSGLDVIKQLRQDGSGVPILLLTARDSVSDKVSGLDSGADDYLEKPFNFDELTARIRALLRRPIVQKQPIMVVSGVSLDPATKQVQRHETIIELSSKEFALLDYLMRHEGLPLSKQQIIEHVWDFDADVLENTVEAFIASLRRKLEKPFPELPKLIRTRRGEGYTFGGNHV